MECVIANVAYKLKTVIMSTIRLPKTAKINHGLSMKVMGKYRYWVALYRVGKKWKAVRLDACTVQEAREERDRVYAKLKTRKGYVPNVKK